MPVPDVEAAPSAIPNHSAHPGHKLKRVNADDGRELFICGGCKEPGTGTRYACDHEPERCNGFALHTCCAVALDRLTHPTFGLHRVFLFLQKPEPPRAGTAARSCVVCSEDVLGFVYHCFDDDIDLHPCCARLPEHAIIRGDEARVFALGKEVPAPVRGRETSDDDNQSLKVHVHQPPAARHRQLDGGQAEKKDTPPVENSQPMNNRVLEVQRQVVTRSGDAPNDRNRGPGRAPPPARHRGWPWKR